MNFWSVFTSLASKNTRGFAGIGLVMLAAAPAAPVFAQDAQPAAASAKPATPVKPAQPAKAKSAAALGPAECVRTGQRVISALARDDSGAASQFHTFYVAFKCSPQHLAQAFGCLVNLQSVTPGLSNPSPEQVKQCWDDPSVLPKVTAQPAPQPAGEKK